MHFETLNPAQQQAVDQIAGRISQYLEARYLAIRRMNPKLDLVWEDLTWQSMNSLRTSLSNFKAHGPLRLNVAETFVGDDEKRQHDFLNPTHQNSIFPEVIDQADKKDSQRTAGQLEIHDMRTLYQSVEASLQNVVQLIQTFIWWDIVDAIDLARFEVKAQRVQAFTTSGVGDETRAWYQQSRKLPSPPSDEEVILIELVGMRASHDNFQARRVGEPGYKMIVRRDPAPHETAEALIPALANQMAISQRLHSGGGLDDQLRAQFAPALGVEPAAVTADRAIVFIDRLVAENRERLRSALLGGASGKPYDMKARQAAELHQRYVQLLGGRTLPEPTVATAPKPEQR